MSIALVKQQWQKSTEPLRLEQTNSCTTMALDNVAHGLKHFSHLLSKTRCNQARFAVIVQLKTWALNKSTIQSLLEHYLKQAEYTQQNLHLDPFSHDESIASLCEQLVFLSAVFEQESELINQMVLGDAQLLLCD